MKPVVVFGCGLAFIASRASAQPGEPSVIAGYVAPPECASADAFQQRVAEELAHQPPPIHQWRFSVTIRHEDDFVGTLETQGGLRELHATTCDEVTTALAEVIADAELPPLGPPQVLLIPVVPSVVAEPPAVVWRDETRIASRARVEIGIAMSVVGIAAATFGVSRVGTAHTTDVCPGSVMCQSRQIDVTGIALIGGGVSLAVGGVLMTALGLKHKHVAIQVGPVGATGAVMGTF